MKVLVTGAAGFMGAGLCSRLAEQGHEVWALIMPGEDFSHISRCISGVREGDITDPVSLRGLADGFDAVYHLAARVIDYGTYDDFYRPIVRGTLNMLNACAGTAGRFVYVSSICACGTGRNMRGMTEDDPCLKTGVHYGDAKMEAEALVRERAGKFPGGCVIARPSNVIGPHSVWVDELSRMMRESLFAYFDGGRHSASLVHISNLIDGLVLCGTSDIEGCRTYFFRDDWKVTWKRYLDDLADINGVRIRMNIPFRIAWVLGCAAEMVCGPPGLRPPVTKQAAGLMGRDNDVDCSRARTELGWETRVSYEEAIRGIREYLKAAPASR